MNEPADMPVESSGFKMSLQMDQHSLDTAGRMCFFENTVTWDMTLFSLVDLYHLYRSLTSGQYGLKFKGFSSSGLYCVLRSSAVSWDQRQVCLYFRVILDLGSVAAMNWTARLWQK